VVRLQEEAKGFSLFRSFQTGYGGQFLQNWYRVLSPRR